MRLFSSNAFDLLGPDHIKNFLTHLNTKDLFRCREINTLFNKTFELYFEKSKRQEIEDYIKNLTQFWAKVVTKLIEGKNVIRRPKSIFLNNIIEKLLHDIFPFFIASGNVTKEIRNKEPQKKTKALSLLNY